MLIFVRVRVAERLTFFSRGSLLTLVEVGACPGRRFLRRVRPAARGPRPAAHWEQKTIVSI